jgi:flagellar biosynthesis/type III secretory pathway protein FliH
MLDGLEDHRCIYKESEVKELKDKYEQDMKAMRQEIREEMKEQLAQLATQLKPEVLKQGLVNNKTQSELYTK